MPSRSKTSSRSPLAVSCAYRRASAARNSSSADGSSLTAAPGEPCEDRRLAEADLPHVLVEVVERRLLDAVVRPAEVDLVQVEKKDVVLGEVLLQAQRKEDLLELAPQPFLVPQEEVLHHLLGDGGSAESFLAAQRIDDCGAGERERIEARMLVEVLVLRRDHRLH